MGSMLLGTATQVIWMRLGLADARKPGWGGRLARFAGALHASPA
jgi:hypothetical protein